MKIVLNKEKIKKSIKILIILILAFIVFLYLNKRFSFFIPCPIHHITGLHCPGCGATRMVLNLLQLNFYKAFRCNPFLFTISPFLIIYHIIYYFKWIQDKPFKINNKIWYVLLIIAILFMILRNIPAFSYLAPH